VSERAGEVLLGKYTIEHELGRGGMGYVVAARHRELDELVAIKLILNEHAQNDEVVRRFMREARAAAKIASEHVVRVMDVGRLPTGEPYMVMELLRGQDLEQLLATRGTLSIAETVDYVVQALEAVAEAHAVGIIHRDLKPANLYVTPRRSGVPCVKVLDFGISKLTSGNATAAALTKTQGALGSPLYMSPEQLQSSSDVDHRTDIWALGVILFQLMSGQLPFVADSLPQLVVKVLGSEPSGLRELRPEVPAALEQVVLRCLLKDRAARYASVTELARALAPFGSDAARASLVAVESALPSGPAVQRDGSSPAIAVPSTPRLPAPSSPEATTGPKGTIAMWPSHGSTLEPVDTRVPEAPPNRKNPAIISALLLLGLATCVFIAVGVRMSSAKGSATTSTSDATAGGVALRPSAEEPAAAYAEKLVAEEPVKEVVSPSAALAPVPRATAPVTSAKTAFVEPAKPVTRAAAQPAQAGNKGEPAAKPVAAPAAQATANCTPPYTVGAGGAHIPKPECL
jgi:serine/threonine-protein kinase